MNKEKKKQKHKKKQEFIFMNNFFATGVFTDVLEQEKKSESDYVLKEIAEQSLERSESEIENIKINRF